MTKKILQSVEVLVIGGGASGMMAAGRAAELGAQVVLIEKNDALGEKLKITGGGRCNVTNAEFDTPALLGHYGSAAKFLYSPFSQFKPADTFVFFESRRLPLVVEDRKRAFPHTHQAWDVYRVMEKYVQETGRVTTLLGSPALRIGHDAGRITEVETPTHIFAPAEVIVATGGTSHPETGSTGDGFGWLRELGHNVQIPTPHVVPLAVTDTWVHSLSGRAFEDVKITFYVESPDKKKAFVKKGRILCTHFGLSGPMILNSAGQVRDLLHSGPVTAQIDLFPTLDTGTLEKNLVALFDEHKNKMLKTLLPQFLPDGFMPAFALLFPTIDLTTKVHSVLKQDRKTLAHGLKSLEVNIEGLMGLDRAVISDGGVPLSEIDTRTMRSKKIDNLYVTGDLLHINRPSGGYSLQLCWTTGWVAGSDVGGVLE